MTTTPHSPHTPPPTPRRIEMPSALAFGGYLLFLGFLLWSLSSVGLSLNDFIDGVPQMGRLVGEMFPPDTNRINTIALAILETFQIALVGAVIGIAISFFLAICAARNLSPHPIVYHASRSLISFFRTVPDLVWAIFFVASVGLGAFAGTLTIMVDTIGFCGRFFAEGMEEVERGPQEALGAMGAHPFAVVFAAVVPAATPSMVNSSMYALERAVRSSVVLGLVGAGGIGIELKVAMDMFMYAEAATIIILIFILVLAVERVSTWTQKRFVQ